MYVYEELLEGFLQIKKCPVTNPILQFYHKNVHLDWRGTGQEITSCHDGGNCPTRWRRFVKWFLDYNSGDHKIVFR